MIFGLYSIFDEDLRTYTIPFCVSTDTVAIGQFLVYVSDMHYEFGNAYEDFSLYKVGSFNKKTGEISPCLEFITKGEC